jgi:hypothetical protein
MFVQFDNGGRKFVLAYVSLSNNRTKAKYNSYEGCFNYLNDFIILMLFLW